MIKDIPNLKVEDLAIAIVPRTEEATGNIDPYFWESFLINLKEESITNVIINTRGYGVLGGEQRKTATFRHFFEKVEPLDIIKIELIESQLLTLNHEFWVSFQYEQKLYDKKYIFVTGSIDPTNFTTIPFLGRQGVMIR